MCQPIDLQRFRSLRVGGSITTLHGCPAELTGHTIFYVTDNGIGIEPRHFAQVFKLFKRLHGRDEYGGGGGVGLTIVRKLVERHHGRVWLDSCPGQGTTVYFTLSSGDTHTA